MSSRLRVVVDFSNLSETDLQSALAPDSNAPGLSVRRLSDLLRKVAGYSKAATVEIGTAMERATATLTFTDQPVADEAFVLVGTTFTAKGGDASGDEEWDLTSGGTAAADAAGNAASVAALVNAHPTVSLIVEAEAALGVVTFTAKTPGKGGNGLVLSESLTNATIVTFAGGDETLETVSLL